MGLISRVSSRTYRSNRKSRSNNNRQKKMANDFKASLLFGCFSNCCVALFAYFLPCLPYGQALGDANVCSCPIGAAISFVPILDCFCLAKAREATREKNNISGSFLGDLLVSYFCPFCTIIQVRAEQSDDMGLSVEAGDMQRV